MAQDITFAGEQLFTTQAQLNQALDIDTFIFANVPGQDPTTPIDRNEGLPPVAQRVHTQAVQQKGKINDNIVVYSTVLESITGPFEFNWVGLYSSVHQTLIAVQHIPTVNKTTTEGGAAGNTLNRNFGIQYSGIAALTDITVDAQTWQLDFTTRLAGMDKLTQQLAKDMNGENWFIDDGFEVYARATVNTFGVKPGVAYVSGLRVDLENETVLVAESYPQNVYIDAWFEGDASSTWKPQHEVVMTSQTKNSYVDESGKQHYMIKIAVINDTDNVEDLRALNGFNYKINEHLGSKNAHHGDNIEIDNYVNANTRSKMIDLLERAKPNRPFSIKNINKQLVVFVGDSHTAGQGANETGGKLVPGLKAPNGVDDGFHKRDQSSGTFVDQFARTLQSKLKLGLEDRVAPASEESFYNEYHGEWNFESNYNANIFDNNEYASSTIGSEGTSYVIKRSDPSKPRNWFKINFRKYPQGGILRVHFREVNPNATPNLTRTKNAVWRQASEIALYRVDGGDLNNIDTYSETSSYNNSVEYLLPHLGCWEVKLIIINGGEGRTSAYIQSHEIEICQFVNAGRGNHTTLDYLGESVGIGAGGAGDWDHTDHLKEVLDLEPTLIVFQPMIINDWFHGVNLNDTRSALSEMFQRIKNEGVDIIVIGPAPVITESAKFDWHENPESEVLEPLNDNIKGQGRYLDYYDIVEQLCGYYSISFINNYFYFLYRYYKNDHQNWTLGNLAGRIHVNQHGHDIYYQSLARYTGLSNIIIN